MKTERPEGSLITSHDFVRHHSRQHLDLFLIFLPRLRRIAHNGRIHVERHTLLHAESKQRELLHGVRRKIIEIQHRDARAIIRQNQSRPPFAMAVGRRGGMDRVLHHLGLMNIVVRGRNLQYTRLECHEIHLLRLAHTRKGQSGFRQFERVGGRRVLQQLGKRGHGAEANYSMNVTLLISFSVVTPLRAFAMADSRKKVMPSSRAMRLISDAGRLSKIISRMCSLKSSSSWMAVRPRNPVPPHSKHPGPSYSVTSRHSSGFSPLSTKYASGY